MRNKKRWAWVILLAGVLLATTILPAAAKTTTTYVTGYCLFVEGPHATDVRVWYPGQNGIHMRTDILAVDCNYTDDRLDGVYLAEINWAVKAYSEPFFYFVGHDQGKLSLTAANGDLLWDGLRNSFFDELGGFSGTNIVHGHGIYAGLKATMDMWGNLQDPGFFIAGTIIDPGN